MFRNQTYPKHLLEWIIVDDGTDKINDLVAESGIPQIKYFEVSEKMSLGAKRNYMHSLCDSKSEFIVYMDDDDYYPPERIAHSVGTLMKNPHALCGGASELYIVYKGLNGPGSISLYQAGPYGPNHATAGTFAFRKKLLREHKYDDTAALAEEKSFLRNYTVPFCQFDPLKTILVFAHEHNTFDKRKMLDTPHPLYFKESTKTIEMFIKKGGKGQIEESVRRFFLTDIDTVLKPYLPGSANMKPDVLMQMRLLEKKRKEMEKKMFEEEQKQQRQQKRLTAPPVQPPNMLDSFQQLIGMQPQTQPPQSPPQQEPFIMMKREDCAEPQKLSLSECVQLLQNQNNVITNLISRCNQLEAEVRFLRGKI